MFNVRLFQAEQIHILETEIQNFKISAKLLQDENRQLKDSQESNEYEMLVKLRYVIKKNMTRLKTGS